MTVEDPFFEAEAVEEVQAVRRDARAEAAARAAEARRVWQEERVHSGQPPLEPVRLYIELDHEYVKKPKVGKKQPLGCAVCGRAKKWMGHHAYPESFNAGGSSRNPHAWQNEKKLWSAFFKEELARLGLPRGLGGVFVEGTLTFPTKRMERGPDQGNYRHPIEKHLGDALQEGSWLANDNWLSYSFGNLSWKYRRGVRAMELILLPRWDLVTVEDQLQEDSSRGQGTLL